MSDIPETNAVWGNAQDIPAALREMKKSCQANLGYVPEHPQFLCSPKKFQWLVDEGWINPDGSLTPKGEAEIGKAVFVAVGGNVEDYR